MPRQRKRPELLRFITRQLVVNITPENLRKWWTRYGYHKQCELPRVEVQYELFDDASTIYYYASLRSRKAHAEVQ